MRSPIWAPQEPTAQAAHRRQMHAEHDLRYPPLALARRLVSKHRATPSFRTVARSKIPNSGGVTVACNHDVHQMARRKTIQSWAGQLNSLRAGATVVSLRAKVIAASRLTFVTSPMPRTARTGQSRSCPCFLRRPPSGADVGGAGCSLRLVLDAKQRFLQVCRFLGNRQGDVPPVLAAIDRQA